MYALAGFRRIVNRATVSALLGGMFLTGCELPPQAARVELAQDETLRISRAVWNDFLDYKSKVLFDEGAFVVTETGLGAGYTFCPLPLRCHRSTNYVRRAINLCEKEGVKCVLFAEGSQIVVNYEIID